MNERMNEGTNERMIDRSNPPRGQRKDEQLRRIGWNEKRGGSTHNAKNVYPKHNAHTQHTQKKKYDSNVGTEAQLLLLQGVHNKSTLLYYGGRACPGCPLYLFTPLLFQTALSKTTVSSRTYPKASRFPPSNRSVHAHRIIEGMGRCFLPLSLPPCFSSSCRRDPTTAARQSSLW